uniref:Uncharacterized protein n=1 Tax=Physcomitrium patens TaxID=3218 RepID=A0A2K1JDU0_PHYPA|nr:hypothetical protein PHYPA_019974 [Physcomitrium patens]
MNATNQLINQIHPKTLSPKHTSFSLCQSNDRHSSTYFNQTFIHSFFHPFITHRMVFPRPT